MLPQVVVIAGGLGTRLGSEYSNIPKILAKVNGTPFLTLQLEKLIEAGAEHVHYLLGYKSELVISFLKESSFPIEISHTIEPPELLGTGGALLNAVEELDKEFLLTYGDSYLLADFDKVHSRANESGFSNIMCVTEAIDEESIFNVCYSRGRVHRYTKNPKDRRNNALDYGLLKLQKSSILRFKPSVRKFDLSDLFNFLIDNNELYSLLVNDKYFDIGSPTRLRKLEEFLSDNRR
jgi:NDP-sugar pyrophosphorylase family protein